MTVGRFAGIELQGEQLSSGGAFQLRRPARIGGSVNVGGWTTCVDAESALVVTYCDQELCIEDAFSEALRHANLGLDYMCALAKGDAVITDPYTESLTWARRADVVTMRATAILPIAPEFSATGTVRDKDGNVVPQVVPPPPTLHDAMRFMRIARASNALFEAYRNMFLAMESLLHHLYPQSKGGEGKWFKDALAQADSMVPVSTLVPDGEPDPIQWAYDNIYCDFRSGLMHAKRMYHLPGDETRRIEMEDAFESLWRYVGGLMGKVLGTPARGGYLSEYGWKKMCEAVIGLTRPVITNDQCPPQEGPFAPGGGGVIEMGHGTITYPEPKVGIADSACTGDDVRSLGVITRIGTVGENDLMASWSDFPKGLEVGCSVAEFQVRTGIRYANANGVRTHFAM
ncbi:hypothetical protein [Mycobacterium sp. OTB74]|uniref:hypothetical protein n=1 Tax=Mycobacterium sp. OTB74 TaxID=1853452 RepID=UPI002476143C|nr:hypothetical protein [Mycobacterium sp. OTB74]